MVLAADKNAKNFFRCFKQRFGKIKKTFFNATIVICLAAMNKLDFDFNILITVINMFEYDIKKIDL